MTVTGAHIRHWLATCDVCGMATNELEQTGLCPHEPHGREYDLYGFDVDGTLIQSYMDDPSPSTAFPHVHVLPGRVERLRHLLSIGAKIAFITNQAGVAFGYQTVDETRNKLREVRRQLVPSSACVSMHIAFGHPESNDPQYKALAAIHRRKPHPEMLLEAMGGWSVAPHRTVYVGDLSTDRQFAANAGVAYIDAEDFFHE